jgi:hypothetical protein
MEGNMKICSKCKEKKGYDSFYKDKKAKDGYNGICKSCRLEMDRNRRKNDPDWVERRRLQNKCFHENNRESIANRKKEWIQSPNGKLSHRKSSLEWKKKNRIKVRAHSAIERAVARGIIIPKDKCEFCNSTKKIEAHHPDHRKTLSVIWLCKICHEKIT